MLRRRSLLLAGGILFALDGRASAKTAVPKKFRRWLGRAKLAVLLAAGRVEPFAVKSWPAGHPQLARSAPIPVLPPGTPATIQGFPVYGVGPVQPRAFAERLVRVLLDETSYWADGKPFGNRLLKACIPMWGVAFRVWASRGSVDVLVCFTCDQLAVGPSRGNLKWPGGLVMGDVDPSRAALVALAREALPAVPEIQTITPIRPY